MTLALILRERWAVDDPYLDFLEFMHDLYEYKQIYQVSEEERLEMSLRECPLCACNSVLLSAQHKAITCPECGTQFTLPRFAQSGSLQPLVDNFNRRPEVLHASRK